MVLKKNVAQVAGVVFKRDYSGTGFRDKNRFVCIVDTNRLFLSFKFKKERNIRMIKKFIKI